MITRKMQVTERTESLKQTFFELLCDNGNAPDDRMTLVFTANAPDWKPGQVVTVEVK